VVAVADLYHERSRTVVFLDGRAYHATAAAFEHDHGVDALLSVSGYRPLRFTWSDVHDRAQRTVRRLLAAIALPPPESTA
jgi:very-short-patch-repair endonuclease